METALVLSADRYEFADEKTGELRRVTLQYVTDYREDTGTAVGFKPIKAPALNEVFDAVKKSGAPGIYRLTTKTRPGKEGKPALMVIKADLVKGLAIFDQK